VQLSNVRRIIVEDYPQDQRETVGKLAEILNSFMEEVVQLSQGNIGIDNLTRNIVKIDITVDALGKPMGVSQIQTGLTSYTGKNIVDVQSLSGGDNVISSPYLDCTYQGNGLVKVNKFTGLPAGKKLRVTIEFIG
jgi:hypothetical protein